MRPSNAKIIFVLIIVVTMLLVAWLIVSSGNRIRKIEQGVEPAGETI